MVIVVDRAGRATSPQTRCAQLRHALARAEDEDGRIIERHCKADCAGRPLHADGARDGDYGGQRLWYHRYRQSDAEDEHVDAWLATEQAEP